MVTAIDKQVPPYSRETILGAYSLGRTSRYSPSRVHTARVAIGAAQGDRGLEAIPVKYIDFIDMFSKELASKLPKLSSYSHIIKLKDSKEPPYRLIYNLS